MNKSLWAALVLAVISLQCGGGDESSLSPSGNTEVTIAVGEETGTASYTGVEQLRNAAAIPSDVAAIRFTIAAPDIVTIQRLVATSRQGSISESFEVPNGPNRQFLAEALDLSGNVTYKGETSADLEGVPISLTIVMNPTSTTTLPTTTTTIPTTTTTIPTTTTTTTHPTTTTTTTTTTSTTTTTTITTTTTTHRTTTTTTTTSTTTSTLGLSIRWSDQNSLCLSSS